MAHAALLDSARCAARRRHSWYSAGHRHASRGRAGATEAADAAIVSPLADGDVPPAGSLLAALRMQWRRKQRVSPAHQPVGEEADPLLRGRVELVKGYGASNVPGE
jgi:hypothetical protein